MFKSCYSLAIRVGLLITGTALSLNFLGVTTVRAEDIEPQAKTILRSMSDYLRNLKAFTVEADIDFESINKDGQKIQLTSFGKIILARPNQFYLKRQGVFANLEGFFDGNTVTIYGRNANAYFQFKSPGSIDDALFNTSLEMPFELPASDLLYTNSYKTLIMGVENGSYYGKTYVNGVECHHLGFRKDEVDWQLWIQTGKTPLPMKYIITSKWITSAPQYSIRFRNWDTKPQITANQFKFIVPQGAIKLKSIQLNELGEPILEGGKQGEN